MEAYFLGKRKEIPTFSAKVVVQKIGKSGQCRAGQGQSIDPAPARPWAASHNNSLTQINVTPGGLP